MARGFRPLSPVAQGTHLPRGGPPRPVGSFPTSPETSHLCPARGTEGGSRAAVLCWALPGVSLVAHQLLQDKRLCLRGSSTVSLLQHGCAVHPAAPAASPQQELALTPASASLRSFAIPHTTTLLRRLRFEGGFS